MRIIFLGTPEFAVKPLENIFNNSQRLGVEIVAVVTNPDKPVGRKQVLTACPVKLKAIELGLNVLQYGKIRVEGLDDLRNLRPDLMITCAFGQILSQEILDIAKFGVINIHGSLLPEYRGASPIQSAIADGKAITGVTIMKTDIGIDTGDILLKKEVKIPQDSTAGDLFQMLSEVGAEAVLEAIQLIKDGNAQFIPQGEGATLTKMIKKENAFIDWNDDANTINNKIRAYNPSPICYTNYLGQPLKIYKAEVSDGQGDVGEILNVDKKLEIACKTGSLILQEVQKSGGNRMKISDFMCGFRLKKGEILS